MVDRLVCVENKQVRGSGEPVRCFFSQCGEIMLPDRVQGASARVQSASALFFLPVRMFSQPVRCFFYQCGVKFRRGAVFSCQCAVFPVRAAKICFPTLFRVPVRMFGQPVRGFRQPVRGKGDK